MGSLIWIGAAMALAGLAGIVWCIVTVMRARRSGMEETALKALLQRVVAVNLGAFGLSALGLGLVVAGLFLG